MSIPSISISLSLPPLYLSVSLSSSPLIYWGVSFISVARGPGDNLLPARYPPPPHTHTHYYYKTNENMMVLLYLVTLHKLSNASNWQVLLHKNANVQVHHTEEGDLLVPPPLDKIMATPLVQDPIWDTQSHNTTFVEVLGVSTWGRGVDQLRPSLDNPWAILLLKAVMSSP